MIQYARKGERMTLKEIEELALDETIGVLRKPKNMEGLTAQEIFDAHQTFLVIVKNIIKNPDRDKFLNSMFGKRIMRRVGIKKVKLVDSKIGIYSIQTTFGEGTFFDAHRLFQDGKYPKWVTPGYCFSNAFYHTMMSEMQAKVESGIAYTNKQFLHSVIATEDQIIDFNYDLVIDKNLYKALLHFEVLAELESEKIRGIKKLCLEHSGLFRTVQDYQINFAFDEVMQKVQQEFKKSTIVVGAIA